MAIRGFDLFCGAGGSSWGARGARVEMLGGIDLCDKAVETYMLNFPNAVAFSQPIRTLAATKVAENVGPPRAEP